MAKTTLPLKPTYGLGEVDVTIINPKNNKSAKTILEFDTGSPTSVIPHSFLRTLGINTTDGKSSPQGTYSIYFLLLKIGNLKPLRTTVAIANTNNLGHFSSLNVIGYDTIKQFKNISYTSKSITFEDNNPEVDTNASMNMLRLFATYIAGVGGVDTDKYYSHPVTFYNKKTGSPVVIQMEVDTGTEYPNLDLKWAKQLGIDDVKGDSIETQDITNVLGLSTGYTHRLTIKIGNLKPMQTRVVFSANQKPLLGLNDIMKNIRIDIAGDKLKYTELAAMAEAHKSFYGYPRWYTKRI